ncbi:MAG TPA: hypothetical protein VFM28_02305 [Nitrososphaeraceae archaeon]|jgi:hypothetical protein|nr:hypothetical protein [Nitrososphaeraceae archaeon]
MSNILWNKFDRVIELQLEGKTIREISREVHISFRDILKIIKVYDRKVRLQQSKKIQQKEQVIIDNIIEELDKKRDIAINKKKIY